MKRNMKMMGKSLRSPRTNIALDVGATIFTLVWFSFFQPPAFHFHFGVPLVLGPSPSLVAFGP